MEVNDSTKFSPVTLTLESEAELLLVTRLLGSTTPAFRMDITGEDLTTEVDSAWESLHDICLRVGINTRKGGDVVIEAIERSY